MKNYKILIVDDEPANITVLMGILGSVYDIYVAIDGQSALEIATSEDKPDLILLDIVMPVMDGYEVAHELKHNPLTSAIPFIFLTAKDDNESVIRGFREGAVDYLTKPFRQEELLVRVENHLQKQKLQNSLSDALDALQKKMDELSKSKQEFEAIFNHSKSGIALTDLDTNFILVNDSCSRITGFTKEELLTKSCIELIDKRDIAKSKEVLQTVMDTGQVENFEKLCLGKDKITQVNTSISLMPDKKRLLFNTIDITSLKNAEKKIAQYVDIMDKNIISSSTDLDGVITDVSEAFSTLTGYSKGELIGRKHSFLKHVDMKEGAYKMLWDSITHNKIWHGEVKNVKKDGSLFWFNATILPLFNDNEVKIGYMAIREDITDKKFIEELSITDELTKLYNRRYFNEVMQKELRRAKRDNKSLTFLMFDVDHFKLYNDTYGHQEGDNVLLKIATVFHEFSKRGGDYAFRLGGEEFGLIYLPENSSQAKAYATHIVKAVEALQIPHSANSASSFVTVSVGIVFKNPQTDLTLNEIYKIADDCLYKAKERGRNRAVFDER